MKCVVMSMKNYFDEESISVSRFRVLGGISRMVKQHRPDWSMDLLPGYSYERKQCISKPQTFKP